MAAVLFSNANAAPSSSSQSPAAQPAASTSNAPTKSFKMFRSSLQETLRTATRSKAKSKDTALVANETGFVNGLGFVGAVSTRLRRDSRLTKEKESVVSGTKGKQRDTSTSRPSVDASSSSPPAAVEDAHQGHSGLRRLASRSGFGKKKSSMDLSASTSSTAQATTAAARTKGRGSSGGWPSFMSPSISGGSMSSPAIHLASDPNVQDTPASNMSPSTSIGALVSPPRRRPTITSKDSTSSPVKEKAPSSSNGTVRKAPIPPTFTLSSSTKRLPPSPSTPTLGHWGEASTSTDHTARPLPRHSLEQTLSRNTRTPTYNHDRSISSGSGSGSGSGSLSSSPPSIRRPLGAPPPSPTLQRRPTLEQRVQQNSYGRSMSSSHLPSSYNAVSPSVTVARRSSRERAPPPSPISTTIYQRRNSSSASFNNNTNATSQAPARASTSSPTTTTASGSRALSPAMYKGHGRNPSTTSLAGTKPLSAQRETMRLAATFVIREMAKPPPAAMRSSPTSPYGGLAGAPAGVKADPWEEVEIRLQPLARMERLWERSGVIGTIRAGSSATVNTTAGATTVSSGSEERERRAFCEAFRDGYVLAQLMNRLNPTSPLPIPRVDPREDGFTKTSNVVKFRDAARTFITKSGSGDSRDVLKVMFGKDDLADGGIDGVVRVAKVLNLLSTLKGEGSGQRWPTKVEGSSSRHSKEMERDPASSSQHGTTSRPSYGSSDYGTMSTPNLANSVKGSVPPIKKRYSPPSPDGFTSPEPSIDSRASSALDRRASLDRTTATRKVSLGPAPIASPPSPPPTTTRSPITSEHRSSFGQQKFQLSAPPSSPPPHPPPIRSPLRAAPSFSVASNRASFASSAQSGGTDNTNLFEGYSNHRTSSSNRFGTMRTVNTTHTDATSILPIDGSWGREDASNAALALELADALPDAGSAPVTPSSPAVKEKRRSYDTKGALSASPLGLAFQQSHPPVSAADLFSEGSISPRNGRRERRSSEIAVDLTTVMEAATDAEGSIKPKPAAARRISDGRAGETAALAGLNVRKGKWPEDFVGLFSDPSTSSSSPKTSHMHRNVTEPNAKSILLQELEGDDDEATPKVVKSPNATSHPITIVTSPSRRHTPQDEKDQLISSAEPLRRPTHRPGALSVDVLLPRPPNERRISLTRRVSNDRREMRLTGHDRDSSGSGSGDSPALDAPIRRPLRRPSTRENSSSSRQGMYLGKRPSVGGSDEFGSTSGLLPAASSSVPAVSHIRVPFPRSSSGEHSPLIREPLSARNPNFPQRQPDLGAREDMPSPDPDLSAPTRPSLSRLRYQSELETPRILRRGSAGVGDRMIGSNGTDDDPRMALRGRSRIESLQNGGMSGSGNLTRGSSMNSGGGSNLKRTLIVKEEGRAPMHYQLGNCIGKGQFGAVYRALNLNTGQMVAVKRIRLEGLPETEVTQLMKEVELLKKLQHPSIVSYEGMVRDEDSLDIVLEYVENGSLSQTLKAFNKFNEKLVATYVTKILEGLHYLHEQQVVHCDLKAANILSTKNGNIKLSDFGVSLALNAMENAKEKESVKDNVTGTPNWMAPEVIELKGASTASDIWSLGCTVVELLTGRPPYSDIGNSLSVMFRIVDDDTPPIPEGCSEPLRDFLTLCFKKNPADRPTAEVLFEHPWLKRTWGLNEDSVPFLRRVSTDLHKSDLARQLSIYNLHDSQLGSEAARVSPRPGTLFLEEPEFVTKPHSFVKTTFSKHVTCRVCHQLVKKSAVLCEECSLICHQTCAKDATPHCDVRAQLLLYSQYSSHTNGGSNGSPHTSTPGALHSPGIPIPPSPASNDPPLSSSPSYANKLFAWKRSSKSGEVASGSPGSPVMAGSADDLRRRSGGGGGFLFRRSEDRSRSRRDSMQDSQHSSSMRSGATMASQGSDSRGRKHELRRQQSKLSTVTAAPVDQMEESQQQSQPRQNAQTIVASLQQSRPSLQVSHPSLPKSRTVPAPEPSTPSDAPRRRRTRQDSEASKSDCTIQ
ncbi:hypothetical protein FRB98_005077 [Tulasnella sp. 332]|nr:hypothetical protein FRB98_005077 [Tulasnella sp. 332]